MVGEYLIESKTTDKKSLRVTAEMLKKITKEALQRAKIPVVRIRIQDEAWYVVPEKVWEGMMSDG